MAIGSPMPPGIQGESAQIVEVENYELGFEPENAISRRDHFVALKYD